MRQGVSLEQRLRVPSPIGHCLGRREPSTLANSFDLLEGPVFEQTFNHDARGYGTVPAKASRYQDRYRPRDRYRDPVWVAGWV